ncbi:MAG: glycoside hydrolase family 32 protein [Spirochaetaceae bacterium]|jgi:beta-fructofuranosidase|nr:glycoside hydrolase family 32 protein [Spirochaetaceae bacterium]
MTQRIKDYYRPVYHISPPSGWMNDPNGLIQFRGKYHVFYQHYPYAPKDGPKHWGHVISDDLVHWERLPIALTPDTDYEKGCWSGSAVNNHDELTLIYTAHDESRKPKQVQCIASSVDGVNFKKHEKNPVISGPPEGFGEDFRDPKVFRYGEWWYLVVGCTKNNEGGILLYGSKDLLSWDCFGRICQSSGNQGTMWECPDLFELEGTWVLLCSPMNMEGSKCIFISGTMDFRPHEKRGLFIQENWQDVDYGLDFYAPQTFIDDRGRRILIGWMDMWNSEYITCQNGWIGALTFPRELYREHGVIRQRPVEEVSLLRKTCFWNGNISLTSGQRGNLKAVSGSSMEIAFTIPGTAKGSVSLCLRACEDRRKKTLLVYDFDSRTFIIDKRQAGAGKPDYKKIPIDADEKITVHILVDKSSVEFFLSGRAVSCRIYPDPSWVFYDIFSDGDDMVIPDLRIYELG